MTVPKWPGTGVNVVPVKRLAHSLITNDGVTIAKEIELKNISRSQIGIVKVFQSNDIAGTWLSDQTVSDPSYRPEGIKNVSKITAAIRRWSGARKTNHSAVPYVAVGYLTG